MRKNFIGLILLASLIFLSTAQTAFSTEVLTTSVSKNSYVIGENVTVKMDVYNSYGKAINAYWLFYFDPPIEEYPGDYGGGGLLAAGDYHEKTFIVKVETGVGQHVIVARLFNSSDRKLLYENNATQFFVEENKGTSVTTTTPPTKPVIDMTIPLMVIAVLVLIAIVYIIFYKRKKKT